MAGKSRNGETVVIDTGRNKSTCGYCQSGERTSITHGLWANSITVGDYQDLLDRGWRRSGSYIYKPDMEKTCCPAYTIRLKAVDFTPSKEQLRVSKRMQRYLDGNLDKPIGSLNASKDPCCSARGEASTSTANECLDGKHEPKSETEQVLHNLSDQIDNAVNSCVRSGKLPGSIQFPKASVKKVLPGKNKIAAKELENLLYTCNIAFLIAAAIRRAQSTEKNIRQLRLQVNNAEDEGAPSDFSPKLVAEMLTNSLPQTIQTPGLSIRACNGHINIYSTQKQASLNQGDQTGPSSDEVLRKCNNKGRGLKERREIPLVGRRKLEIHLKRSTFDQEEFSLYKKYQVNVHNDKPHSVTETSYKRFLVDTPLIFVPPTNDGTVCPCGFGSFHQQYVIDGKLIAVGVIDILPKCLSSKYLFWDPDYAFLSLGKYSALQEIEWVRKNQVHCSSLQYYYLGYYIHSCLKMRYKAAYHPSELLCPLRYQWVPYDISKPLLDKNRYTILSDYTILETGEPSAPLVRKDLMEMQHDDHLQDSNDVFMDDDDGEEMIELDYESSDDKYETGITRPFETQQDDVGNIPIGLKESRFRYKDISHVFGHDARSSMEAQLQRYMRVVGADLSKRMVYSLQ